MLVCHPYYIQEIPGILRSTVSTCVQWYSSGIPMVIGLAPFPTANRPTASNSYMALAPVLNFFLGLISCCSHCRTCASLLLGLPRCEELAATTNVRTCLPLRMIVQELLNPSVRSNSKPVQNVFLCVFSACEHIAAVGLTPASTTPICQIAMLH
jgi:hypothetical protein